MTGSGNGLSHRACGEMEPMSPRLLLIVTALVEAPTGLCLLFFPELLFALLFGSRQPAPETLWVGRVAGAALLAIGVASGLGRCDTRSRAHLGLLTGILIYNAVAAAVLAASASTWKPVGIALWPAVLLHTALGVWCLAALLEARRHPPIVREADHSEIIET